MNNSSTQNFTEINILQLIAAVWHRIWIVIIAVLLFTASAFVYTYFFITPTYKASTLMYVNNSSLSFDSAKISISSSELSAAKSLIDTYNVILKTRLTLNEVIKYAKLDYTYEQLKKMISSSSVNATEVFEIVVTSNDPAEAEYIANAIAIVLLNQISEIVEGSSVRIVDYAVIPASSSSPSYSKNLMIGAMLGGILSVGIIVLLELFDTIIRSEQYLTQNYDIPVLASIPDMHDTVSSNKYYKKNYRVYDYQSSGNKRGV